MVPRHVYNLKSDVRNDNPQHEFVVSRDLEKIVDLRNDMPKVYDQGTLGSCTANALGAAFEANQMANRIPFSVMGCFTKEKEIQPFMPSRLFLYYNERVLGGNIPYDSGAALEDGVMSLYKDGVCPEVDWPYVESKFKTRPPKSIYRKAKRTRIGNYKKIPQTLPQLRACLANGYSISFGMQIFESFESDLVASSGIVSYPRPSEECYGGHAVLLCGYNDYLNMFTVRNSWGEDWGDKGYFYMPYDYVLSSLCRDFWVLLNVTD